MHLPGERGKVHEALLIPQLLDELNLNLATVKVAGKIEHVRLKERLRAPDRRSRAQACHPRQRLRPGPAYAHREYPGKRRALAVQLHICGGKSQLASQMTSMHHAPDHGIGSAEPALGMR